MAATTAESGEDVPAQQHTETQPAASDTLESDTIEVVDAAGAPSHTHTASMETVRLSSVETPEGALTQPETHEVEQEDNASSGELTNPPASVEAKEEDAKPAETTAADRISLPNEKIHQQHSDTTVEQDQTLESEQPDEVVPQSATVEDADIDAQTPTPTESRDDDRTLHNLDTDLPSTIVAEPEQRSVRSQSRSTRSSQSSGSEQVDWAKLDKNEEQEERDDGTDESTAFLLARLEQENNAIATDPKSSLASNRNRKGSRPPSIQQIKKLVLEPTKSTLRYSTLPSPPPMTELEFWSALVRNYPQTAQRLPTLTANKIRNGIPAPLRGVVWMSIAGARDTALEETYDKLCQDSSPYEKIIHKDIGRSFPGVDMFRDPDGEGQRMLGKVLNAFSLYDQDIGYCQGLGFVVGPLLMHMGDKEAFCTLVRLMDHYDLRSCFLPNLTGLHLRIYQYQQLLAQHLPELTAHLDALNVEPLYISQWFLSFFGVTCPLPMLIRLFDVILTEGASETLMRVALSLMRRNEKKILAATEFEDVIQLLLSRALWDTYNYNADELISDFCNWTGLVTREILQSLETAFKETQSPTSISKPSVHTAAQRFLGRLWNSSGAAALMSPKSPLAISPLAPPRPASALRRTTSKQSMASTLNSVEGSEASQATISTDATTMSRQFSTDFASKSVTTPKATPNKDKDLHNQIEELLKAMSNLQRENSDLADQLQREREERDEERVFVTKVVKQLKGETVQEADAEDEEPKEADLDPLASAELAVSELETRFTLASKRSSLATQTKHQLREEVLRWKTKYSEEASRSVDLSQQLTERERDIASLKDDLRDARGRIHDSHKEKQRLERSNQELRAKKPVSDTVVKSGTSSPDGTSSPGGLRELRLGRSSTASALQPQWSRRISSLSTQSFSIEDEQKPEHKAEHDALLLELANAKTAEAVAKQELEEMRTKLESFRKLLSGRTDSMTSVPTRATPASSHAPTLSVNSVKTTESEKERSATTPSAAAATANMVGGFFSGWGKRTVSNG